MYVDLSMQLYKCQVVTSNIYSPFAHTDSGSRGDTAYD